MLCSLMHLLTWDAEQRLPSVCSPLHPSTNAPALALRQLGQLLLRSRQVARHVPQNMCPQLSAWQATIQSWQAAHDRCDASTLLMACVPGVPGSGCLPPI